MKEINEIWLLSPTGKCLFNYSNEKSLDPSIFGGFISAINQFGDNFSGEPIQSVNLGGDLLVFNRIPEKELLLVGRGKGCNNTKKMQKILIKISKIFNETYTKTYLEDLTKKNAEFTQFSSEINTLFENTYEKIKVKSS